jgi:hypothetical protein
VFPSLEDWLEIFYSSIAGFQRIAAADPAVAAAAQRAEEFAAAYRADLDRVAAASGCAAPAAARLEVGCLELCRLR